MATSSTEIERKYAVDATTTLPDLAEAGFRVGPVRSQQLTAVYLDTADLTLTTNRITLRRRTGGTDAGWHVKLPASVDARREVHASLSDGSAPTDASGELDLGGTWVVPSALLELVAGLIGEGELRPVAVLANRRDVSDLFAGQRRVAELCDDHVTATSIDPASGDSEESSWREWEVELVESDLTVFETLEPALLTAGALPSDSPSKLARALQPVLARRA